MKTFSLGCLLATITIASHCLAAEPSPGRERLLMDAGWRFLVGKPEADGKSAVSGASIDPTQSFGAFAKAGWVGGPAAPNFKDAGWRTVDLPHDWAVEMPFSERADCAHGSKTVGPQFPASSVAWYRRAFTVPATDEGRRLEVQFDGVFRDCEVFLNGHYLGRNFSGYAPFTYDITPYLTLGGTNTLAVKVNATSFEGWFYEGAGIYRHVWLVKTAPVHVPQWGTFVSSEVHGIPAIPDSAEPTLRGVVHHESPSRLLRRDDRGFRATTTVRTTVRNDSDSRAEVTVDSHMFDGKTEVAIFDPTQRVIEPWTSEEVTQTATFKSPHLWSLEDPHLYTVKTELRADGKTVDSCATTTGIRTLRYDPDRGFFLNGKHVFMKGTSNHQDHAGVGVALPDRVNEWRIEQLKSMGCNAYRSSHNPPSAELLDACDRLGMLVMDENRTVGATDEALSQLERLIRRDRNHPSVVIWSLGNEEMGIQGSKTGAQILAPLHRLATHLDPTRPTTIAMNGAWGSGFSGIVDVQGCNYLKIGGGFDKFHKNFPQKPVVGSEEASHTTTRGSYSQDSARNFCHADPDKGKSPGWASTPDAWVNYYAQRPYLCGGFAWTGFDYRGEPTPFHHWPSINSNFGILDTCGFPKDIFYYYQAWWTEKPVLHLMPHWNWPDKVGQPIDVRCESNAAEVELFVNGASQGRKPMARLAHLNWAVPYRPGVLSAKGYNATGVQVSEERIETTGAPAGIRMTPDRADIAADGEDVAMITVAITDEQGRVAPTAGNLVHFALTGPGRILGVGNGDPTCHEPDQFTDSKAWQRSTFNGLAQIIVQAGRSSGDLVLTASGDGLKPAIVKITTTAATPRPAAK